MSEPWTEIAESNVSNAEEDALWNQQTLGGDSMLTPVEIPIVKLEETDEFIKLPGKLLFGKESYLLLSRRRGEREDLHTSRKK